MNGSAKRVSESVIGAAELESVADGLSWAPNALQLGWATAQGGCTASDDGVLVLALGGERAW